MRDLPSELRVEVQDSIATITLNRPDKLNALTREMLEGLDRAMEALSADDAVSVIVLTGTGRAFCSGVDLGGYIPELMAGGPDAIDPPTIHYFSEVPKPLVAAVNGLCVAAGTEMLLGTDIRVAVSDAWFALAEVSAGLVPSGGSHVRLPRQIPWAVAMEMLLMGERITAERACRVGLINEVVASPAELMPRALAIARKIAQNSPTAVRTAKSIAVAALQLDTPFRLETAMSRQVLNSPDAIEGFTAFKERRPPNFQRG
jgi:enoyl-CoA hydratase/carnithine racemase